MSSRRVLKVAEAIREVVSMAILTQIRDPRVQDVTVTFVEVSGDLRQARVHFSVMGDEKKQRLCLQGLRHAAGFLQRKVGDRVDMKFTPQLSFEIDRGFQNAMAVTRILNEVLPKPPVEEDVDDELEDTSEWDPGGEDDAHEDFAREP